MRRLMGVGLAFALLVPTGAAAPSAGRTTAVSDAFSSLRADQRECPSPMCGGFFVRRVNRAQTRCVDGAARPECYVAEVELERTGLTGVALERASAGLGDGALVRGRIVPRSADGFPGLGDLDASEVWLRTGRTSGRVYRVRDTGLACVASPCFSFRAGLVNGQTRTSLSSVELSGVGGSAALLRRARTAMRTGSLLVAGTIRAVPDAGPAGTGRELVAAALYLRVR